MTDQQAPQPPQPQPEPAMWGAQPKAPPSEQRKKTWGWWLAAVVFAWIIGLGMGLGDDSPTPASATPAPTETVTVPGPTVTVEADPETIEREVTPGSCTLALDYAEEGFGITAQMMEAAGTAFGKIGEGDLDAALDAVNKIDGYTAQINKLSPKYRAASAQCRAG